MILILVVNLPGWVPNLLLQKELIRKCSWSGIFPWVCSWVLIGWWIDRCVATRCVRRVLKVMIPLMWAGHHDLSFFSLSLSLFLGVDGMMVGFAAPMTGQISPECLPGYCNRYLSLSQQYAHIIVGHTFGHVHTDWFRIIRDSENSPVGTMYISPALTTYQDLNPSSLYAIFSLSLSLSLFSSPSRYMQVWYFPFSLSCLFLFFKGGILFVLFFPQIFLPLLWFFFFSFCFLSFYSFSYSKVRPRSSVLCYHWCSYVLFTPRLR